jgi:hypothetical protein
LTIYYQHIGEKLWARDAPRSIGTAKDGLKRFVWLDIEPFFKALDGWEVANLKSEVETLAPTGFQIWGIPSGAKGTIKSMKTGDFIMFLESTDFSYVGQVIHRVSQPLHDLSMHIWREPKFPLILLLQGELITYGWDEFSSAFGFDPKYHMRGTTANLADARVQQSRFKTEEAFISSLLTKIGPRPFDQQVDFSAFGSNLQTHFRLVKARAQQQAFRKNVLDAQDRKCAVCDISIPAALDAAHLVPKEHNGSDDVRNGIVLCALHHRLFDAAIFAIHPTTREIHVLEDLSLTDLKISRPGIGHLQKPPHKDALTWRWQWFSGADL